MLSILVLFVETPYIPVLHKCNCERSAGAEGTCTERRETPTAVTYFSTESFERWAGTTRPGPL